MAYGGAAKIIDFIPTSVKIIDDYAFYDNEFRMDLTSVTLPNSITTIGRSAFSYNKLTSIIIPKSVTDIDYGAFVNNEITSFILPAAEKSGYLFENWNGNIAANTEVTELWGKYTANFSKILLDQTIDFEALSNATYGGDNIELTATSSKIVYKELPSDDPLQRQPDISLAKKELDWEPKIQLHDGLVKTIEYFKSL